MKDPTASDAASRAQFTCALVGALRGDHPALVTPGTGAGSGLGNEVGPRPGAG